jgi:hypothetical protein
LAADIFVIEEERQPNYIYLFVFVFLHPLVVVSGWRSLGALVDEDGFAVDIAMKQLLQVEAH